MGRQSQREVNEALDALGAEQLRDLLRELLDAVAPRERDALVATILESAARPSTGKRRPASPGERAAVAAECFAEAACQVGQADPSSVDEHLEAGTVACHAGDYAIARRIFDALLPPVADGEIDLGQEELVEEVLTVDLQECASCYLTSAYHTTPPDERPDAVFRAFGIVESLAWLSDPVAAMEQVSPEPLPDLAAFLPSWTERLQREARGSWFGGALREAIARTEGTAGLARRARTSRQPEDLRAWGEALARQGDREAALEAYAEAAMLVEEWTRGEFLDRAAALAHALGRDDFLARIEKAWREAPSLLRLLRWLTMQEPDPAEIVRRAQAAQQVCPPGADHLLGLLAVLQQEPVTAATLLGRAPGLGWSRDGHPGHVLFATLTWLLGGSPPGSLRERVTECLRRRPTAWLLADEELDDEEDGRGEAGDARLPTPDILSALQAVGLPKALSRSVQLSLLGELRRAAEARVASVVEAKRRNHYGHAALLAGACSELAQHLGDDQAGAAWIEALRQRIHRYPAMKQELAASLARTRS